jgi:YD repeat-containing protein
VAKSGSGLATLTSSFTYESSFNKVASATDPRAQVTSYTYTAQGLPLTVTSPADTAGVSPVTTFAYTAYTAAGLPAFYLQTGAVTGTSVTYDGNGTLIGDGVWSYDLDNRLKSATKTGYAATLAYDGEGRLRQTTLGGTVTNLLYDGGDLIAEYDGANVLLRRYVHGPGVDEPLLWYGGATTTSKTWLYADHQRSIVAQANSAGTSTATYSYGPFGEPNQLTR